MKTGIDKSFKLQVLKDTVGSSGEYTTMEMIFFFVYRMFFAWLKEKGAYKKYRANIAEYNLSMKKDIDCVVQRFSIPKMLDYSFPWALTNEGADFWFIKHKQWRTFIADLTYHEKCVYDAFGFFDVRNDRKGY